VLLDNPVWRRKLGVPTTVAYVDEHGWDRLIAPPEFRVAAAYIVTEVRTAYDVGRLLSLIDGTSNGSMDEFEGTGDAFTIHLQGKSVSIQCEYNDDEYIEMDAGDLRELLLVWRPLVLHK